MAAKDDEGKSSWKEVPPGDKESGTPDDAFDDFTFWVPSDGLEKEIFEDARDAGRKGLPNVEGPNPLDEPDALTRLRSVVTDLCYGRTKVAVNIFTPSRRKIAEYSETVVLGAASSANDRRAAAQLKAIRVSLAGLEAEVERLEDALNARLQLLETHFDRLASHYTHELKQHHPFPDILELRWNPEKFQLEDDMFDFGQDTARKDLRRAREKDQ
ncbi:hypothetical protein ACFQNE_11505 [Gordonia phosphorivorans]|uniref:Uncharacterized protein n=1 Tax=Gordonia phosphorivorans TaxID=1056982 RepID=A0ABV6HAY6_9ACTN